MNRFVLFSAVLFSFLPSLARGQAMPADYQQVLTTLGRQGDFKANVLKVNIPRNDLSVTVAGIRTPTPFGFGGWVAMTKGNEGGEVLMGDLVLTEDEVNPVMSALLTNGIDVTALHNHFFWEQPRIFYMHVHGTGTAADLTRRLKPALDSFGRGATSSATQPGTATPSAAAPQSAANLDGAALARIVGRGRADRSRVQDHDWPSRSAHPGARRRDHGAHGPEHLGCIRRHRRRCHRRR